MKITFFDLIIPKPSNIFLLFSVPEITKIFIESRAKSKRGIYKNFEVLSVQGYFVNYVKNCRLIVTKKILYDAEF